MVRKYTQIRLASNWHIWFHITSIMSRFLSGFCMLFCDASSSSINICYFKLSVRNLGSLCSNWGLSYSIIVLSVFFLYTFSCLLALNILIQLFLLKQAVNCSLHSFSQLWPMEVGPDYWTNWQFLIPCGCSFLIRNLSFVSSWMDSYCHL